MTKQSTDQQKHENMWRSEHMQLYELAYTKKQYILAFSAGKTHPVEHVYPCIDLGLNFCLPMLEPMPKKNIPGLFEIN